MIISNTNFAVFTRALCTLNLLSLDNACSTLCSYFMVLRVSSRLKNFAE